MNQFDLAELVEKLGGVRKLRNLIEENEMLKQENNTLKKHVKILKESDNEPKLLAQIVELKKQNGDLRSSLVTVMEER